jgi:hypothetical protein
VYAGILKVVCGKNFVLRMEKQNLLQIFIQIISMLFQVLYFVRILICVQRISILGRGCGTAGLKENEIMDKILCAEMCAET